MRNQMLEIEVEGLQEANDMLKHNLKSTQLRNEELKARERELIESNSLHADAAQEMETTIASLAQALALARNWRPLARDALERVREQREEINKNLARAKRLERALALACEEMNYCPALTSRDCIKGQRTECKYNQTAFAECWRIHFERLAGDE